MSAIDQPFSTRRRAAMLAAAAAVTLVLSACGAGGGNPVGNDQHSTPASSTSSAHAGHPSDSMPGMPGMDHAAGGNGLSANESGLTLQPGSGSLRAGVDTTWTYRITAAGKPVTVFESEQTKLMHLYVVRSDLTGFQHAHPVMASDGTWTANLTALQPGSYRIYTQFSTRAPGGTDCRGVVGAGNGARRARDRGARCGCPQRPGGRLHRRCRCERHRRRGRRTIADDQQGRATGSRSAAVPGQLRAPDRDSRG